MKAPGSDSDDSTRVGETDPGLRRFFASAEVTLSAAETIGGSASRELQQQPGADGSGEPDAS